MYHGHRTLYNGKDFQNVPLVEKLLRSCRTEKIDCTAMTYISVLTNQPTVHSGGVGRGRVCGLRRYPVYFFKVTTKVRFNFLVYKTRNKLLSKVWIEQYNSIPQIMSPCQQAKNVQITPEELAPDNKEKRQVPEKETGRESK